MSSSSTLQFGDREMDKTFKTECYLFLPDKVSKICLFSQTLLLRESVVEVLVRYERAEWTERGSGNKRVRSP